MTTNYHKLMALAAFSGALTVLGTAAHADNTQASGEAVVIQPLQLVNVTDLQFGTILTSATAGTVTVNPYTNARTSTGGVTLIGNDGLAAHFVTYGGPLQYLYVTRGPLPVLQNQNGPGTMNVQNLTLDGSTFRYLNAAGVVNLKVGGRLAVGANQPSGHYAGQYEITVTYY